MQTKTTKTTKPRSKWRSKSGPKPVTKWYYGKESELLLVVQVAGKFLKNIASLDVSSKYRRATGSNTYSTAHKIEMLKKLFEKGGTRGISFIPAAVEFAAICPNPAGTGMADLRQALEVWKPGSGWQANRKLELPEPRTTWRAWMAGSPRNVTITFDKVQAVHSEFCSRFLANKMDIASRYADGDSGELPAGFLIACHLAQEALAIAASGTYSRCYIYNSGKSEAICRVDLGTGRLMAFNGGSGWANPTIFQTI